jgi:hypothetical protein
MYHPSNALNFRLVLNHSIASYVVLQEEVLDQEAEDQCKRAQEEFNTAAVEQKYIWASEYDNGSYLSQENSVKDRY